MGFEQKMKKMIKLTCNTHIKHIKHLEMIEIPLPQGWFSSQWKIAKTLAFPSPSSNQKLTFRDETSANQG